MDLLFRDDAYLKSCEAAVVSADESGIRLDRTKEILGLWIEQSEGAQFCYRRGAAFLPRIQDISLNY